MSVTSRAHILIVEDDKSLANWMGDFLLENKFDISIANRGDEAINLVKIDDPDIIILDINLPVRNGFEVCQEIREFYSKPVLMLTARGDESDEVSGLEAGANDYLIKPVRPKALLARVNALLGRTGAQRKSQHLREYGSFRIDTKSRSVYLENLLVELTTHEFDLLWLLCEQADRVFSRDEMVGQLRGIEYDGFNRTVDITISRIRKKLHDDTKKPYKIKTVWGKGYMFASDAW